MFRVLCADFITLVLLLNDQKAPDFLNIVENRKDIIYIQKVVEGNKHSHRKYLKLKNGFGNLKRSFFQPVILERGVIHSHMQ